MHRLSHWTKKQDAAISQTQVTHFKYKYKDKLKGKGWIKIYHASTNQKTARVATFISDKVDFRTRIITPGKKGHFKTLKESVHSKGV